jgi:hypothetical protein
MYGWGKELTLETVESSRFRLVLTEDDGPMMIGSPRVLVDVAESCRSIFTCEYPDVDAEGPRDSIPFWMKDRESVCGFASGGGGEAGGNT